MPDKTVFSCLIDGELPCAKLFESEQVFAFMASEPIRPGHALVVPKAPIPDFFDVDDATIAEIMSVAKRIARAIEIEFKPKRVGLVVAGFDVPHAHLHVIPMHEYHDITSPSLLDDTIRKSPLNELEANAIRIRRFL